MKLRKHPLSVDVWLCWAFIAAWALSGCGAWGCSSSWSVVSRAWALAAVHGAALPHGAWSLEHGLCLAAVHGASLPHGAWSLEHGLCLAAVHGAALPRGARSLERGLWLQCMGPPSLVERGLQSVGSRVAVPSLVVPSPVGSSQTRG